MLKTAARTIAWPGRGAAGRDQGGDRVGGVVKPVGQREGDRERDGEPEFHERYYLRSMYVRRRDEIEPYVTRDGSTIREWAGPGYSPAANQSLAEATVAPGAATIRHYHRAAEELYLVTAGPRPAADRRGGARGRGRRLRRDRARRAAPPAQHRRGRPSRRLRLLAAPTRTRTPSSARRVRAGRAAESAGRPDALEVAGGHVRLAARLRGLIAADFLAALRPAGGRPATRFGRRPRPQAARGRGRGPRSGPRPAGPGRPTRPARAGRRSGSSSPG